MMALCRKKLRKTFLYISVSAFMICNFLIYKENHTVSLKIAWMDNWQTISLSNGYNLYLYSAFYDNVQEDKPIIKVTAVGKKWQPAYSNISCTALYSDLSPNTTTPCRLTDIKEWHPSFYHSKWLIIELLDDRAPSLVYIKGVGPSHAKLQVHNPQGSGRLFSISVCVRPLHKSFDDVSALVEFIEFYLLFGASHFMFYNQSVGPSVSRALEYYQRKGLVSLLAYDLPVYNQTVADGQYTVLQDCYLRCRGVYQYVLMVDVDEFVLPRQHSSLQEVIAASYLPNAAAYNFASLTFCNNFQRDQSVQKYLLDIAEERNYIGAQPLKLQTQELILAANEPCPIPDKSKMIVDPWKIDETGVHFATKYRKGYKRVSVNPSIAMVHHYRGCPDNKWLGSCPAFPNPEVDGSAQKYLDTLANRVLDVYLDIGF